VAQRFTAAINSLFSVTASAAEVKMQTAQGFFRSLFSRAAPGQLTRGLFP